jgi:tetratricopeptide (TPR) repeat protein/S1-C subfamily serine protease
MMSKVSASVSGRLRVAIRSGATLLAAVWLAGCAGSNRSRELAKFDGAVVRRAETVPVLQAARKGLVTVLAQDSRGQTVGFGSGFYIQSNQVVTCLHVVDPATVVQIIGADGRVHPVAGIFAAEPTLDAAVLWVTNPPPEGGILPIRSAPAVVGEKAYALGAPERLPIKQSEGEVVRVLDLGTQTLVGSLVLSVPVVPGFSGGPVLDAGGRVIGVTGAISAMGTNRYCLAIPIERIAPLREPVPTSLLSWRRSFPAPPFPAFVEATKGERIVNDDPREALDHFERAILLAPDYTRAWVQKAACLLRLDRIEEAEQAYAKSVELSPSLPVPRLMRAVCLEKLGRYDEAIGQLDQVVQFQPRSLEPWLMLVSVHAGRGDFGEALRAARRAVALDPAKPEAQIALGTVLNRIGEPAASLVAFRAAAGLSPDRSAVWETVCALELELDNDDAARAAGERALSVPDMDRPGAAEYLLALVALRADDVPAARQRFARAMQLEARSAKGSALPKEAVAALRILEKQGVSAANTHREMGGFFAKTGRIKEARAALEQAVRMEPRDPRSWSGLSQVCVAEWRDRRAGDAALRAIALNGEERFAHQSLGAAHALNGRLAEARREMEAELRVTGPNANTHLALAAIESRAGRPATSRDWLEKARALDAALAKRFENGVERFLPDAAAIRAEARMAD